jgi:TRAP-type C4-dicarboxylate transport system permease small subunit
MTVGAAPGPIRLLVEVERAVIGGLMVAITLLTLAQVVWRYVLEMPLQWSQRSPATALFG